MTRQEWIQKRKKDGKCLQCGAKAGPKSKLYCNKCSKVFNENAKQRAKLLIEQGLCVQCMNPSDVRTCRVCADKNNIARTQKVKEREQIGLCIGCGKGLPLPGNRKCVVCYLKHLAWTYFHSTAKWEKLNELFDSQKGICPYTGRKLIMGQDAEIDHIISRYQGGRDELGNYQWVHRDINRMKTYQSHAQFLNLVREVYRHSCQ